MAFRRRPKHSVSRILWPGRVAPTPDNDHSSMDGGCPPPLATYPEARTGRPQMLPYLVLHRVGFTQLPRSPGELVSSYLTVSPLPGRQPSNSKAACQAVCFLLHLPSRHRDSTLWSTLPCGVRTFLQTMKGPAIVWNTSTVKWSS